MPANSNIFRRNKLIISRSELFFLFFINITFFSKKQLCTFIFFALSAPLTILLLPSNKNFTGTLAVNSFAKFQNYDCKQCPKLYYALNKFKLQPIKYIITCHETQDKAANYQAGGWGGGGRNILKTHFIRVFLSCYLVSVSSGRYRSFMVYQALD